MVKIAAVSDCHGMLDRVVDFPEADILIIAGDYCPNFIDYRFVSKTAISTGEDAVHQLAWLETTFIPFLQTLKYKKIIIVSGNHDWVHYHPETRDLARKALAPVAQYIQDEIIEVEGIKIYGSPWQPWFHNWAFNLPRHDRGKSTTKYTWDKIPEGMDVLIFHGPPFDILDETLEGEKVGCPYMAKKIFSLYQKPKLVLFGHVHESYGVYRSTNITFGNVSLCTRKYTPTNPIQVFSI